MNPPSRPRSSIAVVGALLSSAALTALQRGRSASFYFALTATPQPLTLLSSQHRPVLGQLIGREGERDPESWESLRRQWEYSHAASALLYLLALAMLALSVIVERR